MNLDQTDEQRQMIATLDALLASEYPLSRLRRDKGETLDPLARFGLFDLAAAGMPATEALLHARLGRHLVGASALARAAAVRLAGTGPLADGIGAGRVAVSAGVVSGADLLLLDTPGAGVAVWRDGAALRWGAIEPGQGAQAAGGGLPLTRTRRPDSARAAAPDHWQLLVCAQLLGVAEGAMDLAVDYAGLRQQFGRPIGSFQAIKHHAANMALGVAMLSAQLDFAALSLEGNLPDAPFQIAALARLAPGVALKNARLAIQIHGGIGFSAEADVHLFLKQAHRLAQLLPQTDLLALSAPLTHGG